MLLYIFYLFFAYFLLLEHRVYIFRESTLDDHTKRKDRCMYLLLDLVSRYLALFILISCR